MSRKRINTVAIIVFAIASIGIISGISERITGFSMGVMITTLSYFIAEYFRKAGRKNI